ncbi:AbfB domain-containing protein [Nonomuraea sp. NPDC049400]|uniref:AbfB domain-containing protein n=1 Tax=Nonomuraea sp. NPDC049400 TaxID=3364352 RepID=UPI003795C917
MTTQPSRRSVLRAAVTVGAGAAVLPALPADAAAVKHPGLLHTQADFDRMRAQVNAGAQPWKAGWDKLVANGRSRSTWKARPLETVVRGGTGANHVQLAIDVAAAYQNALRWKISGEKAHGDTARDVLNAWSATLKAVNGNADRYLAAGIQGWQLANVGEIMRGYPGFDFERFTKMMLTVFYPMNDRFLREHNGACITNYWANWDLCNMASILAIGVLADDQAKVDQAVEYFKHGKGNGAIMNAVPFLHPGGLGQWQESGRDQGHTSVGVGWMGVLCEMAWNQGIDLYGYAGDRFMKGAEYVAKYNLGETVPFTTYKWGHSTTCAQRQQTEISAAGRGATEPIWALLLNHYGVRRGLAVPYIEAYSKRVAPEGGGGDYGGSKYDHLGFGTLTFTRATGGGLLATGVSRALESVNRQKAYIQATGRIGADPLVLRVVPGLDGAKGYSFVAPDGRYLRHRDFVIRFEANDGTALFRRDATFHARQGTAGGSVRLESVNYPGRFVRHRGDRLRLDKAEDTALFRADSSFRPVTPS